MRLTVIGHSCLRAETAAGTILVDPWLEGSCYWRSWWHFPPSVDVDDELLSPDWLYLTHHHFDHFHYPSMRRIDKNAEVLIPKFGVDVMAGEVESLGFARPTELTHARILDLGDGVTVASFQYGFDDTAFVIKEGDTVVVDLNDAKIRGRSLRQVVKHFGHPTIACKSHSFAQSYPAHYTADDPDDLRLVSASSLIGDFHHAMSILRPRYAIPFGSMVGFLHPDSRDANQFQVTPRAVVDGIEAKGGLPGTEVVAMSPGYSWSEAGGFVRSEVDWYADHDRHLDALAERYADRLSAQAEKEDGVTVEWEPFAAHFGALVDEVPRIFSRRLVPQRFVFEVPSDPETPYWWVSFREAAVGRAAHPPPDRSGITTVPEAVLAAAIRDDICHMVHGSMRIRTHVTEGGIQSDLGFWGVLMMWEQGYFPLRRSARRLRLWTACARRWREFLEQAPVVIRRNPVDHLAERFGADV